MVFALGELCIVSMIDLSCKLYVPRLIRGKSLKANQIQAKYNFPLLTTFRNEKLFNVENTFVWKWIFLFSSFPDFFAYFKFNSVSDILFHPRAQYFKAERGMETEMKSLKANLIKTKFVWGNEKNILCHVDKEGRTENE